MQGDKPLVSIGVASYNNAKYILQTLESINNQSYQNIELIIVDDCSTDNSRKLIEEWKGKINLPVKIIHNTNNEGIPKVCNSILGAVGAASKYLCVFGSDDVMLPERIEKQVAIMQNTDDKVAATYSDMIVMNEVGSVMSDSFYKWRGDSFEKVRDIFSKDRNYIIRSLVEKNTVATPALIFKTSILKKMGGWDETLSFEDWDMNLRLIKEGYVILPLNEKLVYYRKHSNSITNKPGVDFLESLLSLVSKHRNISKDINEAINVQIKEHALAIYAMNGKKAAKWLYQKLRVTKDIKTLFYLGCAMLKIPYSVIDKIKSKTRYNAMVCCL